MKISELKIKLHNSLLNLIDTYFGSPSLNEKFINSTLKILIKQNINKFDNILEMFADKNGDINIEDIMNEYANIITDDGIIFDLKDYIDNDIIKNFIPDKSLLIKREDIINLIK